MLRKENKAGNMADKMRDWLSFCKECAGQCCKYIALEIDKPTNKTGYDNIRWYLMHKDVSVFIDHGNKWTLQFPAACENLLPDGKCGVYKNRPRVCSAYPGTNNCEFEGTEPPYKILFKTEKDFLRYLAKKGIDWKWKKK